MAVSERERKAFQKMWDGATPEASGFDIPWDDGKYQFQIIPKKGKVRLGLVTSSTGKPRFNMPLRCVGGDEADIGTEGVHSENLETQQNMGFFKQKLGRLGITTPQDVNEIFDGGINDEMVGKVFDGQVRWKNDFPNVYVNKLVGDGQVEGDEEDDEVTFSEGDEIYYKWSDGEVYAGTVTTINDGKEELLVDTDGESASISFDDVVDAPDDDEEDDEEDGAETEEEDDDEESDIDWPEDTDEVKRMKNADAHELLESMEIESSLRSAKKTLTAAVGCLDEDTTVQKRELRALAAAMSVKPKKTEKDAKLKGRLATKLEELLAG